MNSFYNDDIIQRVFILWIMAVMVVFGNNAPLVDEDIGAMRSAVASYMVARMSSNIAHLLYSIASYHHRQQQRLWFCMSSVALCIYIPLYFENVSIRAKIAVTAVSIFIEECIWMFCYSPVAKRLLKAKYTTAVDIAHEVDRFAAFYIIALGEFLFWCIVGSPAAVGLNSRVLRAIWTLIIAFCLNWMYVHNDGAVKGTHPVRHSVNTAFAWVSLHLPLIASLLAGGHVAAKTASEEHLDQPQRWLLCGALGTGLICLYLIAALHKSLDAPGTLLLPKVHSFHDQRFSTTC